jgi:hypothetical protein
MLEKRRQFLKLPFKPELCVIVFFIGSLNVIVRPIEFALTILYQNRISGEALLSPFFVILEQQSERGSLRYGKYIALINRCAS